MKHEPVEPGTIKRQRSGWKPAGKAEPEHVAISDERRQRRAQRRDKVRLVRLATPRRKGRDGRGSAR